MSKYFLLLSKYFTFVTSKHSKFVRYEVKNFAIYKLLDFSIQKVVCLDEAKSFQSCARANGLPARGLV